MSNKVTQDLDKILERIPRLEHVQQLKYVAYLHFVITSLHYVMRSRDLPNVAESLEALTPAVPPPIVNKSKSKSSFEALATISPVPISSIGIKIRHGEHSRLF